MAFLDIFGTICAIGCGFLVNHLLGNIKYWNAVIIITVYLFITLLIHTFLKYYCRPFKSGSNPKHLIVIVTGYLGHFSRIKGIQDSFIQHIQSNNTTFGDDILIHLSRNVNTGFFWYTFWKSNDGISRGGMRLSNEIKSILNSNLSIDKISFISGSLGGLYSRYCLKLLFNVINERNIALLNFITLASPHLGTKDWLQQAPLCCCKSVTLYSVAECMKRYHLLPLTLQQLMFLDKDKLIIDMASNIEYLKPLKLFQNRMCFGNAKHDSIVSFKSALILYENECEIADQIWNEMENENKECLVQELMINDDDDDNTDDDNGDEKGDIVCWFEPLRNDMEWKQIVSCWNQHRCARNHSHELLAAPFSWYSGCKLLFDTIFHNFQYSR